MALSSAELVRLLALGLSALVLLACDRGVGKQVATTAATAAPVTASPAPPAMLLSADAPASGSADAGAGDTRSDGRPDCRFERPAVWTAGEVSWLGSCRGGFADGSGVLLNVDRGEFERFYGRLQYGVLSLGVIESAGGYMAGTWSHGALSEALADDVAQRNILIDAFRAGAAAATAASTWVAKRGDAKSSRFYAKQARLMRDQMD
jgi:hypothetical protein